jgi:uncharacterized membrane protein
MDISRSIRRHATAAITATLATAVLVVAALVMTAPTPASATQAQQSPVPAAPWQPASLPSANIAPEVSRQAAADPNGAFIFRNGRFTPLGGIPGAAATGHVNLNNRGQTVGFYADAQGTVRSFVKDRRGRATTFAVPGAPVTLAAGVNDRGQVAGTYYEPGVAIGQDPPPGSIHGFIRQPDGRTTTIDLPARFNGTTVTDTAVTDVNNRGQVVGQYTDPDGNRRGFLREANGRITPVAPRLVVDKVLTLNDRGQVAGAYSDPGTAGQVPIPANTLHGFVWSQGRLTRLDVPRSVATLPLGINNAGHVTGTYADGNGRKHGFLLQRGRYARIDAPGRAGTDAWGINDRGQVVLPEPGNGLAPVAT